MGLSIFHSIIHDYSVHLFPLMGFLVPCGSTKEIAFERNKTLFYSSYQAQINQMFKIKLVELSQALKGKVSSKMKTVSPRCDTLLGNSLFTTQCLAADQQYYLEQCYVDLCYRMDLEQEYPTECQVSLLLPMVFGHNHWWCNGSLLGWQS